MAFADLVRAARRYAVPSDFSPSLVVAGDSIAQLSGTTDTNWGVQSFQTQLHLQTRGGARWNHNAGVAGDTSNDLYVRYDADVIAKNPTVVILEIGTNDLAGGDLAAYLYRVGQMIRKNRAIGARTVVLSLPPRDAYAALAVTWNASLRDLCRKMGVQYVDIHGVLSQADGTYKTAYHVDGTHPNVAGAAAMTKSIISQTPGLWPEPGVIVNFPSSDAFPANGANLTDTNADGLADNWTIFGGGGGTYTPSLVTRVAGLSNWQELYSQAGVANLTMQRTETAGGSTFSPGDNVEVFFRIEADQISAGVFTVELIAADASNATLDSHVLVSTTGVTFESFSDGAVYFPYTVPATTNILKLNVKIASGWCKVRIADVGIVKP